jgi:hypothetical protein
MPGKSVRWRVSASQKVYHFICQMFVSTRSRCGSPLNHKSRLDTGEEMDIDLLDSREGWAPYLSLEDALKLDDVRAALRRGDLENAARLSRVYTLTPVAV